MIISPSWNSDKQSVDSMGDGDSYSIKIAMSEDSLKSYNLTETGANSGVFLGK